MGEPLLYIGRGRAIDDPVLIGQLRLFINRCTGGLQLGQIVETDGYRGYPGIHGVVLPVLMKPAALAAMLPQ